MPKNYKQRPTELNPYANSAHIHGEHIVQLFALYLDVLSVQSLSTLAASLPTLFLAFLFLFPLSRCVRRVSLLLDFPFLFVRCVFFLLFGRRRRHLYNFDFGKRPVGADIVWLSTIFFSFVLQSAMSTLSKLSCTATSTAHVCRQTVHSPNQPKCETDRERANERPKDRAGEFRDCC